MSIHNQSVIIDYRIILIGEDLQDRQVQPSTSPTKSHHQTMFLSAISTCLLNTFLKIP